jgi:ATP-dependent Lon protease
MEIPAEASVMTLSSVTLFPQALLPLHIFEPRYRRMLADVLARERMFIVAMQKPERARETPSQIAGLGLVRVCVNNPDGTSHLILQGLTRVELGKTVRYRPYRVHEIRPLQAHRNNSIVIDALVAKVRDLVTARLEQGLDSATPVKSKSSRPALNAKEVIGYLDKLKNPDQMADLVSCALLPGALERQTILEAVEVETRLKHLIHFLMAEIRQGRKNKRNE